VDLSLARLESFVSELKKERFDYIINFTFSPFSSYLTHALTTENTEVIGYTRHRDGFLAMPDEVSAYFYAQVGIGKNNRVHLSDIFASMIGAQFIEEDWSSPVIETKSLNLPENFITVHVGASETHKSLSPAQWGRAVRYLSQRSPQLKVVLIGSTEEQETARVICATQGNDNIVNLVGQTRIGEIFHILGKTQLFVGCDSAPIHMASLTDTPTLNISVGQVNFWETGPKATLSFILRADQQTDVHGGRLGEIIAQLLEGQVPDELITRGLGMTSYKVNGEKPADSFQWNLIQNIYMGAAAPLAEKMQFIEGAMKLDEINNFALEQLALVPRRGLTAIAPFLDRAEEIIHSVEAWVPDLKPLIQWYRAEKIRISPGSDERLLEATLTVHQRLKQSLSVYIPHEDFLKEGTEDGTL